MGIQGYQIIAIGMYFQLLASTICFYGIGMKEPVLFVFVYGLSFLVYLVVVLVSTFVFE